MSDSFYIAIAAISIGVVGYTLLRWVYHELCGMAKHL